MNRFCKIISENVLNLKPSAKYFVRASEPELDGVRPAPELETGAGKIFLVWKWLRIR